MSGPLPSVGEGARRAGEEGYRQTRFAAAAIIALAIATPAFAQDCTLANAFYNQPGTHWELRFEPVPYDSASNQFNEFRIAIPGADASRVIEGEIYVPNGYSPNWGDMSVACGQAGDVQCKPWEGTAYALVGDVIVPLPHEDEPPPRQVLFPGFAANIWYSEYRAALLEDDENLGDVFTFAGCSP